MAEQFYTILTSVGKAKIANASALGAKVDFKEMALGDGKGEYYNPTETQESLVNEVWRGQIGSVTIDEENPSWIVIETIIPADQGGFMIREAGVFDEEGNLLAIGKYPETYKPIVADGSTKDLRIRMILEVSNTSVVTLKVDPTVILATKKDVDDVRQDVELHIKDYESQKGSPYGIATLDSTGNIPKSQLENVEGMEMHGDEWHTEPYAKQGALSAARNELYEHLLWHELAGLLDTTQYLYGYYVAITDRELDTKINTDETTADIDTTEHRFTVPEGKEVADIVINKFDTPTPVKSIQLTIDRKTSEKTFAIPVDIDSDSINAPLKLNIGDTLRIGANLVKVTAIE